MLKTLYGLTTLNDDIYGLIGFPSRVSKISAIQNNSITDLTYINTPALNEIIIKDTDTSNPL